MTKPRTLFSIVRSLWLRTTRQPGWCNCIICRDEMLNLPDPLGFSQDARKLQKQLRKMPKMPKAYKCKPCIPEEDHHDENDDTCCDITPEDQPNTAARME
ncbi:hypothetical protein ANCCAN_14879 [Ancylostoma caninum]|uniref:Uncharacterized protein n=1 Tax=Ancylostoma caninum TaxID=29170 RepID=A0A368G856_ANCCA|nr:hypothetical protein ANCCAN_14879 [Ancylostoma caninum]